MGLRMAVTQPARLSVWKRITVSEQRYRWIAYAALTTLTLIIFSGAAVRLTGSGLGCHAWPNCSDGRLLPELKTHSMIEYGNRMVTGVVLLPCLLAAFGAYRLRPFRPELVRPALILPIGVFAQAILGGLTVLFDLSWEMVIAHYLLSASLLIAGAVLVWRLRNPGARPVNERAIVWGTRAITVIGAYVIVAGTFATAASPHAGGAGTHDYVERLRVFGSSTLKDLIHLHGHSAAVMGGLLIVLFTYAWRRGASRGLLRALALAGVMMGAQGVLGLVQYYNALPAEVVWAHASLAAVLWLALIFAWLEAGHTTRSRPAPLAR